jgi:hypothetical protein
VIELLIARVFCSVAFGSDHVLASGWDVPRGALLWWLLLPQLDATSATAPNNAAPKPNRTRLICFPPLHGFGSYPSCREAPFSVRLQRRCADEPSASRLVGVPTSR